MTLQKVYKYPENDDHTPNQPLLIEIVKTSKSSISETGAWQDGWTDGKPMYHVFKHKILLAVNDPASWYVHLDYPHPLADLDTWNNYPKEGSG